MNRIEKLQELLQKMPNDNFLRHALALEYIKLGNDDNAKVLFENVLTDSPGYVGSYYHLGKLLERQGETTAAMKWYEKGLLQAKTAKDQHAYNELLAAYEDLAF
jgi:Tfp pilus assembly protein PilF